MDDHEVALQSFRRRSRNKEGTGDMEAGPSVQKMSQELERLFAPPSVETELEEKKEGDCVQDTTPDTFVYESPERGIPPSPVITPTRQDSIIEEATETPPTNENIDNSNENENVRSRLASCLGPAGLTQEATNAMARHVVSKLRKEASAMMSGSGEKKTNEGNATPSYHWASPIARMRDNSVHKETMTFDEESPKRESKTDGEEKRERQKQWKKKAKIAKAKQRRERRQLRDEYTIGTDSQYSNNNPIIGCVLDNVERTDLFKRLSQCSGGIYNRDVCAHGEYDDYGSSSSSDVDDDSTEDYTTVDNGRNRRRQGSRRHGKKKWENQSLDSSSVDTTVPEEMTTSYLVSDDGSDHHDDRNLSRTELDQQFENRSDFAFAGYSSAISGRASTASGSKTSRINHTTTNRLMMNAMMKKIDGPLFEKAFLHDMESKGENMLWHQDTSSIDPTTVLLRLKKGYRLSNGRYCSPRLIWTDLRKRQNYGFELFDIRSLDHASMVHLKDFPYAIPGRSVLIHLNDAKTFIFEAGTEADMMRFVRGMRLVIARLTRSLVTGNLEGSCELLDMGYAASSGGRWEADWSRAMDDVTEAMIENAMVSMTFEV